MSAGNASLQLAAVAIWTMSASGSLAQPVSASIADNKDVPARMEVRPFESLTVTDHQFLIGDNIGTPVTIAGTLSLPQGVAGRVPVVIQLHGSGGLNAGNEVWARLFNRMGVAAFMVDSFSGRRIVQTATDQAQPGRFNMILDAYRALDVLSLNPRIDPTRIAVMGSSRGAQSALYSSLRRFQRMWGRGVDFAAYFPLYTPCDYPDVLDETDVSDNPIRMFHGTADDYVPVANCRALVQRLKAVGKNVELTEFAETWHAYDNLLSSAKPTVAANNQTTRHCTIKEEPRGMIINSETRQPFTYDDPCVERNPHVAFNADATEATHKAVADTLRTAFKLQ